VTYPAPGEDGFDNANDLSWEMTLKGGPDPGVDETISVNAVSDTDTGGFGSFAALLEPGTYHITELLKDGWDNTLKSEECDFTVEYPRDFNRVFSCEFQNTKEGSAKVVKTYLNAPITGPEAFTFQLRQGASATDPGTIIDTQIADASNTGTIEFDNLKPGDYQLCEVVMPGWTTSLSDPFYAAYPPDGDNSVLCTNVAVDPGLTATFSIDNAPPPGGNARTIGYWKNWASCKTSQGKQAPVLDQTMAKATPPGIQLDDKYLLGDQDNPDVAPNCPQAVSLLDKRDDCTGKKEARDPLFNMAAQLVAAELNYAAGAKQCADATAAINSANALLTKYGFTECGYTGKLTPSDKAAANNYAKTLDDYNNNILPCN